jgi:hypothetical protein
VENMSGCQWYRRRVGELERKWDAQWSNKGFAFYLTCPFVCIPRKYAGSRYSIDCFLDGWVTFGEVSSADD